MTGPVFRASRSTPGDDLGCDARTSECDEPRYCPATATPAAADVPRKLRRVTDLSFSITAVLSRTPVSVATPTTWLPFPLTLTLSPKVLPVTFLETDGRPVGRQTKRAAHQTVVEHNFVGMIRAINAGRER
jgi:hypothetical protein